MIRHFSGLIALIYIILSMALGQSRIGEWYHYTSTISPRAVVYHEGLVYMATGGGVLVYDSQEATFSAISANEGLEYTDVNDLVIVDDWLLLGSAAPQGVIQLYNLNTGIVNMIDLDMDEILHIVAHGERAFAVCKQGQDLCIIDLKKDNYTYQYADIYRSYPIDVRDITDLDMWGDSLFITTNSGVLGNDFVYSNLKDPDTWQLMTPSEQAGIVQYFVDSTGHYYLMPYELHHRTVEGWGLYRTFGGGTLRHLMRRSNRDFVISYSNYIRFLTDSGGLYASNPAASQVLAYVDSDSDDVGYAIMNNYGLARYNHSARTWINLPPNTMAGQSYSAVLKLPSGDLVAAGLSGITRFDGQSWYNLIPGYYILSGPDDERIHDYSISASSPYFLADTLFFRGKQSWNMVRLPNGDILVGFKGNLPDQVGILQVNFSDVGGYTAYDTTDGRLDGLASDGYITIRHMATDSDGNVWIANPFSQMRENVLAVYSAVGQWYHFSIEDSWTSTQYALNLTPTEIAFDQKGRIWIGSEVNDHWQASGGLAVLDYGVDLDDKTDDQWEIVPFRLETDHSNTIWSLTFDQNDILWILSPNGVMGYYVEENLSLTRFTQYGPYLSDVPFAEGSKIRVDSQNNKWITTPQYGLWVMLDNTTFWPSVEGINARNSPLLSDEVLDIYLDDEEGLAYLATTKGLSVLRIPFKRDLEDYDKMVIFPSPYYLPSDKDLTVDGLRQGSSVKIYTATGRLVRELTTVGGGVEGYQAFWDGRNARGDWVGSGVYLIAAYLESGRSGVGKVVVLRQ